MRSVLLLTLCSSVAAHAVSVGRGSYAAQLPPGAKGPSRLDGAPAIPKRTAKLQGPMPTNDWWSSLGWQRYPATPHSENLYPHPLGLHARAQGLGVGYPTKPTITQGMPAYIGDYHFNYAEDLVLGVDGLNAPDTKVDGFSAWLVTAQWSSGGTTLTATFGHGSPFVWATRTGGDALVTFTAPPVVVANSGATAIATVNGHTWGLYAPPGCTWSVQGNTFRSTLCGKDFFTVAVLPDAEAATRARFEQAAHAVPTDTQVRWRYDAQTAEVVTTYEASLTARAPNATQTLFALYPHQWRHTTSTFTGDTYVSPRGPMKVVQGTRFETRVKSPGHLPGLPTLGTGDAAKLRGFVDEVFKAPDFQLGGGAGTYWVGKSLERLALLVRVAELVQHEQAKTAFLTTLKTQLELWLSAPAGKTAKLFAYEPAWGTLIGYPAEYGSDQELNDHHFHWGYFIYAAATLAQYEPGWAAKDQWGGMVELLIRDANSPRLDDPLFPWLRSFDPYAGHGWASGHAGFGAGNNQESSSESMNFSHAVALWGAVTKDDSLRDLGLYLYATEGAVIREGWFDEKGTVFPQGFPHQAAGIVWGDGASYATWFSSNPAMIHGINYLPVTPGSLYLAQGPGAVRATLNELSKNAMGEPTAWPDVVWKTLALVDPAAARQKLEASPSYVGEDGETKAHTYHWIHALQSLGTLDLNAHGLTPTSAVFTAGGVRTYVAYNPADAEVTVPFSDGRGLRVPARGVVAGPGEPLSALTDAGTSPADAGPSMADGGLAPTPDGGSPPANCPATAKTTAGCEVAPGFVSMLLAMTFAIRRRRR